MEVANLLPVVDRLENNIDDLEEALEPLLSRSLDETSKKLPLLERAKLHALLTYTLESLIFSYLSLHGTNAKEHPVFKELTRVRQYFVKIKALETPPEEEAKPTMKLDQQAAQRFIAHGLAGNDQYDIERAEKQAKEKARAQLKAAMLARKSKEESSASTPSQEPSKPSTEAESSESEADSSSESEESEDETPTTEQVDTKPAKTVAPMEDFIMLPSEPVADSKNAKKKTAKAKAKQRKEDIINAKKAERQAKRQAKSIPEPDSKQQRKMARKERRRKKEAKRKEKKDNKKKQKQ